MNVKKLLQKAIVLFVIAIAAYSLLSLLSAAFPNSLIEKNVAVSLKILEEEGTYPKYFFNSSAARLDNFTDTLMVSSTLTDPSQSVVENAMVIHQRVQYWQGYLIFLKPLLVFLNLYQIRYLTYISYFLLFIVSAMLLYKKVDIPSAIAYSIAVISSNVLFTSVSLQFIGVYYVMFLSVIVLLFLKDYLLQHFQAALLLFLLIGSFTCFIDFLTVPLITLGIPLLLFIVLRLKGPFCKRIEQFFQTILLSVFWAAGYSLTFICKWVIASLLLQRNAISEALDQLLFRVNGSEELVVSRTEMLLANLQNIVGFNCFSLTEIAGAVILLLVLLGLFCFLFRKKALPCCKTLLKQNAFSYLLILMVGLYPYMWYLVFANHSQIHFWFTYRSQLVTVFSLFYLLCSFLYCGICAVKPARASRPSEPQLPN